ncbi:MAG: hypothetical protein CMM30_02295 [Rhodospirillaceae bacterium]|nr:hypothetical protein [Rhodospirillaceae bacterium]
MFLEPKIKSEIRVKALIKQCDIEMIPVVLLHRGDIDAGAVLLKINLMDGQCILLSQTRDISGKLVWMRTLGEGHFMESKVDEYIKHQLNIDQDLWVLEIEDRKGLYTPTEPVI